MRGAKPHVGVWLFVCRRESGTKTVAASRVTNAECPILAGKVHDCVGGTCVASLFESVGKWIPLGSGSDVSLTKSYVLKTVDAGHVGGHHQSLGVVHGDWSVHHRRCDGFRRVWRGDRQGGLRGLTRGQRFVRDHVDDRTTSREVAQEAARSSEGGHEYTCNSVPCHSGALFQYIVESRAVRRASTVGTTKLRHFRCNENINQPLCPPDACSDAGCERCCVTTEGQITSCGVIKEVRVSAEGFSVIRLCYVDVRARAWVRSGAEQEGWFHYRPEPVENDFHDFGETLAIAALADNQMSVHYA